MGLVQLYFKEKAEARYLNSLNPDSPMLLANAGYREKVYIKARLAQLGKVDTFEYVLTHARYFPNADIVSGFRSGIRWEGSESRRILAEYGLNDSNC